MHFESLQSRTGEHAWIDPVVVRSIHSEHLKEFGGISGIRDVNLLESALTRPQFTAAYTDASVPALAASYAYGLARNHPFLDGNKRSALLNSELFLQINGFVLVATDMECVQTFNDLAAGQVTESQLVAWFLKYSLSSVRAPDVENGPY